MNTKKPFWVMLFALWAILSLTCTRVNTQTAPTAKTLSAAALSTPSTVRSSIESQAATPTFPIELQTVQAFRTGFAATRTAAPTWTPSPSPSPTPTCRPLPTWLTPAATLFANQSKSVTDTLATLMLQTYMSKYEKGRRMPDFAVTYDPFHIEIVDGSIDPNWATTTPITNTNQTLDVFFSYDSRPRPDDEIERYKWFTSKKMLIQDFETRRIYWVKWEDSMPWRPIDIEGWATRDVFAFSQFGNPWHGFLVAIDARAGKVLLTLQMEYWCD